MSASTPLHSDALLQAFEGSRLLADAGFHHGFSTRALERDADAWSRDLGCTRERVFQVSQVHGATVARAAGDPASLRAVEADAVVGRAEEARATGPFAVAIKVADCVPVLLASRRTGDVAAVHAGWRGVVGGVVPAALRVLAESGGAPADVLAAIGPCIGPCCFEVGEDVARTIAHAVGDDAVIARRAGEKAFVDLRRAVRAQLAREGIDAARVDDVGGCTRCDAERYFSYRRDGANAGRQLGVISPSASPASRTAGAAR